MPASHAAENEGGRMPGEGLKEQRDHRRAEEMLPPPEPAAGSPGRGDAQSLSPPRTHDVLITCRLHRDHLSRDLVSKALTLTGTCNSLPPVGAWEDEELEPAANTAPHSPLCNYPGLEDP